MEKENTAQDSKNAAQGADARRETGAAANLGKFKSVDALLNAYNSLEAEFTRRSQALRELEEKPRAKRRKTGAENAPNIRLRPRPSNKAERNRRAARIRFPTASSPKKSKKSRRSTSPRGKHRCGRPRRRGGARKGSLRRLSSRRAAAFPPRPRRACARSKRRANSRRICSAKTGNIQKSRKRAAKID